MKRFISNLLTVCFICYMILLVYFLFFSEEYGRNEPYTTYQYNLELFREIKRYLMYREQIGMVYFAINLLGNVVVFMPFGFLVPVLYREQRKGVHFKGHYFRSGLFVTFLGFSFSLVIICQKKSFVHSEESERRPNMEVRFGNRKRIRFSDKKHPKHGIISVVLGVLSIIILLTLCIVSGHAKGRAGMEIGALGLATMVLSIIGFVLAVRCNKEEDIYHVTPAVGSVLNGIMILLFMVLFNKGAI